MASGVVITVSVSVSVCGVGLLGDSDTDRQGESSLERWRRAVATVLS